MGQCAARAREALTSLHPVGSYFELEGVSLGSIRGWVSNIGAVAEPLKLTRAMSRTRALPPRLRFHADATRRRRSSSHERCEAKISRKSGWS